MAEASLIGLESSVNRFCFTTLEQMPVLYIESAVGYAFGFQTNFFLYSLSSKRAF